PAREVSHLHARKPGAFDHARECFLRREAANAFNKVAVRVGIPGNPLAETWYHRERITLVQRVKPGCLDARELETEKTAARLQHPSHFGERTVNIRDVTDAEGNGAGIHAGVGKWQAFGVATHPLKIGLLHGAC